MTRCKGAAVSRWLALPALMGALASGLLSGCGGREHASPYAAAVFDDPPLYCYRTIGDVDCYRRPLPGAERRLVNYYGPPPDDYERPGPPPAPRLDAPPPAKPPAPGPEAAPTPAPDPAAAAANQPTMLVPAPSPPAAQAGGGEDTATATASAVSAEKPVTAASAEKPASAAGAGEPVMLSPKPRPGTPPAGSSPTETAPLVIEVEGH